MHKRVIVAAFCIAIVSEAIADGFGPVPAIPQSAMDAAAAAAVLAATPGILAQVPPSPVTSVNTKTGNVTTGQFGTAIANQSTGAATWTFAAPFANTPYCFPAAVQGGSPLYTYSITQTAISNTAVTFNVIAALKVLSISLGALTVWSAPGVGTTTVAAWCVSPTG